MIRVGPPTCLLLPLLIVLQIGCAGSLAKLANFQVYDQQATPENGDIQVTYLGASGFLLRRDNDAILIDPFFSNPRLLKALLGPIKSDPKLIDSCLSEVDPNIQDVTAILVSHAHYDHLLDVPHIALEMATEADVYTNLTGKNIINSKFAEHQASGRLFSLSETEDQASEILTLCQDPPFEPWIEISDGIRVMPILSEHAPHIGNFTFFGGSHCKPLKKVPFSAIGYRKGKVYSFVIDFVTPGDPVQVDFRVYFQGSADGVAADCPPHGLRDFDLAILSAAGHQKISQHPHGILKQLKPKRLLVSHWESFFRPLDRMPRTVPRTDVHAFLESLQDACKKYDEIPPPESCLLPAPGSRSVYPIRSRRVEKGNLAQRSPSREPCQCFETRDDPSSRAASKSIKKGEEERGCYWSVSGDD